MKSPEIEPKIGEARREPGKGESGYSEKEQAMDIESRSGDLSGQKRSRTAAPVKDSEAIEEYRNVSRQLDQMIESYLELIEQDLHQAKKLSEDIQKARQTQKEILDRIFEK